jgi:predicted SAM-dependent methyltransferase
MLTFVRMIKVASKPLRTDRNMKPANVSSTKKLAWLPDTIRDPVSLNNNLRRARQRHEFKQILRDLPAKKIIVGANITRFEGWAPTDMGILNLVEASDWADYFKPDSLDAILAEHVWEHLAADEAVIAAKNCFNFLKPGGYLRVAVPDGFHPDPKYIEWVRPGGNGPGADDHKVLHTHETFRNVFASVGFDISLCEYYDEQGVFHSIDWDPADGMIRRSKRFDKANFDRSESGRNFDFTSIILDAIKPADRQT